MRVGMFIKDYGSSLGGTETAVITLKKSLEKEGVIVYVITENLKNTNLTPEFLTDPNIIVLGSVDGNTNHKKVIKKEFIKAVLDLNLDIIHIHDVHFCHDLKQLRTIKKIPTLNTTHFLEYHSRLALNKKYFKLIKDDSIDAINKIKLLESKYRKKYGCNFKKITDTIDYSISISPLSDQELPYFIDKECIERIPVAIDFKNFQNPNLDEVKKIKQKYNIKDTDKILISHGRFGPEKIQHNTIELFAKIKDKNAKLILIGGGYNRYLKLLHKLIKKYNLKERVIMPGIVDNKELKNWFYLSRFGFYNSLQEVQWLSYLEYMSSGKPILVRNIPATKDVIKNGYNGYLFTTDDDFIKYCNLLLNDDNEIEKLTKNTLDSIKDFDIKYYGKKNKDLYLKMLNK